MVLKFDLGFLTREKNLFCVKAGIILRVKLTLTRFGDWESLEEGGREDKQYVV